ncbi:MAG: hypothetical protein E3J22_00585 [Candidatus Aminicenantes bacterium]|nr:MAG: hypothetical protein E3J22_00585 [Candidatus Aminicenantes bacterium]
MRWGYYGILIIFVAFFLLLVLSPNLSCFGRRLKSPFYPLFRRKKRVKKIKTGDYGFSLVDNGDRQKAKEKKQRMSAQSHDTSSEKDDVKKESGASKKKLKTEDYGFSPVDDDK